MSEGKKKILNLYAGIGGNRKLWGDEYEVTAVEYDNEIASIYSDNFTNDTVIVTDAHQYLLDHYKEFDFIWSSPPCQTHTQLMRTNVARWNYAAYPDMQLYQQIIWLTHFFNGKFCVENVKSYYEPLIKPQYVGKHYLWANYKIPDIEIGHRGHDRKGGSISALTKIKGFDLSKYKQKGKRQLLRNCTEPILGLHILNCAMGDFNKNFEQKTLFGNEM
jgi:DNA (cytosine-5)-methyltransferase 1